MKPYKIVAQYKFQRKKCQPVFVLQAVVVDYRQGMMDRIVSSDHDCDEFFQPTVMG